MPVELEAAERVDLELAAELKLPVEHGIEGALVVVHDRPGARVRARQWNAVELADRDAGGRLRPFAGRLKVAPDHRRTDLAIGVALPLHDDVRLGEVDRRTRAADVHKVARVFRLGC